MATSASVLEREFQSATPARTTPAARLDIFFVLGIAIALGAVLTALRVTGLNLGYFLHPIGALVVIGGTLGVTLITTPRHALLHSARRIASLLTTPGLDRGSLIEEITQSARQARRGGMLAVESRLANIANADLRHAFELAVDVSNHAELRLLLETELHIAERQGEADAKTLEVAGGFAPTLGIIGTVIGLIDVLRHFAGVSAGGSGTGYGIGAAFVSTIYGLALANLLLLPLAHRIRARVAENFETGELILEGVLAIASNAHPSLVRMRLESFLRRPAVPHDHP